MHMLVVLLPGCLGFVLFLVLVVFCFVNISQVIG